MSILSPLEGLKLAIHVVGIQVVPVDDQQITNTLTALAIPTPFSLSKRTAVIHLHWFSNLIKELVSNN